MGFYVASFILEKNLKLPQGQNHFYSITEPKKQAILYPIHKGKSLCFFAWRASDYPKLSKEEKRAIVKDLFKGISWIIPDILKELNEELKIYFDSASQIKMTQWSKGRVVLIGDACACMSLLAGQGSSFAMAGAYILSDSLSRSANISGAFKTYEEKLKPVISSKQENAEKFSSSFVPPNKLMIFFRDLFVKLMFLPGIRKITKKQLGGENNDILE